MASKAIRLVACQLAAGKEEDFEPCIDHMPHARFGRMACHMWHVSQNLGGGNIYTLHLVACLNPEGFPGAASVAQALLLPLSMSCW